MINFGIPSVLKSWVDHVARAGKTFSYTESGPVPLLHNKKAYLVVATGGVYSDGPMAGYDYAEKYLRAVLGFFGITNVETIWVEGLALGPDSAEKALIAASERVKDLLAV
jgi:FMN-dependent NADH-azoreductase